MFLSVIFLLKKRNFLSFLSFELLWEQLPKHTPVLRRFLLIDFQWLDFKKLMQFCPTAERRGRAPWVQRYLSASLLNLVTIRTFSRCCHLPSSKRGKKEFSGLLWFEHLQSLTEIFTTGFGNDGRGALCRAWEVIWVQLLLLSTLPKWKKHGKQLFTSHFWNEIPQRDG